MTVFVLFDCVLYEANYFVGVYATREDAIKASDNYHHYGQRAINEVVVGADGAYHSPKVG